MTAYYNEIDPFAAAWLHELINAGHIAPGIVDERDIRDVRPDELAGYAQCHFFAGIGVWSYALRKAGWPDDEPVWTGSCPCQPFSAAGQRKGFNDERHLWPAWHWLVSQRRPVVILGEQVAAKSVDPWLDLVQADVEALDYAFGCVPIPAAGFGAPNIRERAFWVADSMHTFGRPFGFDRQDGRHGADVGRQEALGNAGPCGEIRGLADTGGAACERNTGSFLGAQTEGDSERLVDGRGAVGHSDGGATRRLAYSDGRDASAERKQRGGEQRQLAPYSDAGGVVQPSLARLEGHARHGDNRDQPGRLHAQPARPASAASDAFDRSGATDGFWRAADWLCCTDGKWRPVEPGTFPLAHGTPARVGRLRGYGNAINAEVATAFIEAVIDCLAIPLEEAA